MGCAKVVPIILPWVKRRRSPNIFALYFTRTLFNKIRENLQEGKKEGHSLTIEYNKLLSVNTVQITGRNYYGCSIQFTTLLCASTLGIPCSASQRFYWSLSIKRQRGGWLDVAHPKTKTHPASAAANRFSIFEIHRPVLDAGHNDDHAAFQ